MTMMKIERWIGWAFCAQLLLILVLGGIGAARMGDPTLRTATFLGGGAWLALLLATASSAGSVWASYRGLLQFVACWLIFPLFKGIATVFIAHRADATLLALDRTLWGGASLTEHLLSWQRPWLSELLSTGYFLFYFLVLLPVIGFAKRRHEGEARAFFLGLTTMYLVGFSGYLLVPASGPYAAFPELFSYPVQGGAMTAMLTKLVAAGITGMDVFPSLHSGIGVYVLGFFALGGHRRIALLLTPVVAALVLATVYLRYHYGIDVLAGLLLAALVLAFIRRYRKEIDA